LDAPTEIRRTNRKALGCKGGERLKVNEISENPMKKFKRLDAKFETESADDNKNLMADHLYSLPNIDYPDFFSLK